MHAQPQNPDILTVWMANSAPSTLYSPRRRWRDVVTKDLKATDLGEDEWYEEACRSRPGWRATCRLGLESSSAEVQATAQALAKEVLCDVCSRSFRRG